MTRRLLVLLAGLMAAAVSSAAPRVVSVVDVAPVWAGHPVGFSLLSHDRLQFVGFYDADRRMTIASRPIDSTRWTFKVLPTSVKWDSHNTITMALDDDGQLHVAGNMHGSPLTYFRTTRPLDVTSLERIPAITGANESHCTYPTFLRGPAKEFLFTYRDGHSGGGNQMYDMYDLSAHTWNRLLDEPLTDGGGQMNAYFTGPVRGPDGYFHLAWVWRRHGRMRDKPHAVVRTQQRPEALGISRRRGAEAPDEARRRRCRRSGARARRNHQRQPRHWFRRAKAADHQLSQVRRRRKDSDLQRGSKTGSGKSIKPPIGITAGISAGVARSRSRFILARCARARWSADAVFHTPEVRQRCLDAR